MSEKVKVTLFYSWQSDLPKETNKDVIKNCLIEATLNIKNKFTEVEFLVDESTRATPGSPNIANTIFGKIEKADIFIADISTINRDTQDSVRKNPNPNVLIELGYAIAKIGWERIILLFNSEFGELTKDVPFDISNQRILDYRIKGKDDNNGKGVLKKNLVDALTLIQDKNPPKSSVLSQQTDEEKKRKNDIKNINRIFNHLPLTIMDEILNEFPNFIRNKNIYFNDGFESVTKSIDFNIYDENIKQKVTTFERLWRESLEKYQYYNQIPEKFEFKLNTMGNNQILDELNIIKKQMQIIFHELVDIIRNEWLEIDLDLISYNAIKRYKKYSGLNVDIGHNYIR